MNTAAGHSRANPPDTRVREGKMLSHGHKSPSQEKTAKEEMCQFNGSPERVNHTKLTDCHLRNQPLIL